MAQFDKMKSIAIVVLLAVIAGAEDSCVSFGRCGFVVNELTGHLENAKKCEKDYELMSNCTCLYKKGSGCRFNSDFLNMGTLRNVYNCLKPVSRCERGKRCGYLFYGNLKMGQVECSDGYVLNGRCECEMGKKEVGNEKCEFYKMPAKMYANDNKTILVEMIDCSLIMDTVDLPDGLQLDWKLSPEEAELVVAYSVVNEMNTYFSDNFVYVFGECGNGEWEVNFGGGRKVAGRVKRASRWSAAGNLKIQSECNEGRGESGKVSISSIRKAVSEKCKKSINEQKQKMRKECEKRMNAKVKEIEKERKEREEMQSKLRKVEDELAEMKRKREMRNANVGKQQDLVNKIKDNVNQINAEFNGLRELVIGLSKWCSSGSGDAEAVNYEDELEEIQEEVEESKNEEEEEDEEDMSYDS